QGGEAAPPGQAGPAPRAAAAQPWWRRPAMIAIGLVALVLVSALVSQLIRAPAGSGATAAALPPGVALSHPMLRLHGSNTIGEKLAPMLIQGFLADEGGTEIKVVDGSDPVERNVVARLPKESGPVAVQLFAHGSATAFADLEASNTDIGMASRPINAAELERLTPKLGNLTQPGAEHVVGLDGIAVIVNRLNPVTTLTVEQVARIFSGETGTWDQVGGAPRPIQVFARDEKSGTRDTFKALVLERFKLKLGSAKRLESSSELSDDVAQNPDAIGFIGLPYVRNARALSIADERGSQPLQPTQFTVATEDYPLSRRLFLYTPPQPTDPQAKLTIARFTEFALSPKGQELVQQAGFVPQRAAPERVTAPADAPEGYVRVAARAQRLSLTFRFRPGSDELDNKALRDIERVMAYLQGEPGARVLLMGFADATGSAATNLQLSRDRARSVEAALAARGIAVAEVIGLGATMPLAANDTAPGRQKNRRVEIWVQV
ncbi:MAG TPA: phosphate ABC transporter substrate-binding/OmpA family protein, partial [Burkholderiaceae bacterium]